MNRVVDLFPAGGPVAPELVIGRAAEIDQISHMIRQGVSTAIAGPRRVGKTTVGDAVCAALAAEMVVLERLEVPEHRMDASDLLRAIVRACERVSKRDEITKAGRALRPALEALFMSQVGVPVDLKALFADPATLTTRQTLLLPVAVAQAAGEPVLLFLDELQRVDAHEDGGKSLLADMVDLYSAHPEVVVLVDGSDERLLEEMWDAAQLGKLLRRESLSPTINATEWRAALPQRFAQAGLSIGRDPLEQLITFGAGRPYATMLACQYAALSATQLATETVTELDVDGAIIATERQLG